MKFTKIPIVSLVGAKGGTEFKLTSEKSHEPFSVYAYSNGIELVGRTSRIQTTEELDSLAKVIGEAWNVSTGLRHE